jgi:hypothetical protein
MTNSNISIEQIHHGITSELQKGPTYRNFYGRDVHMTTPKELFYIIKGIGLQLERDSRAIAGFSYPEETPERQIGMAKVLRQVAQVIEYNAYDTVLWMPEIWDAATDGCEAFKDKIYDVALAPQLGVFWWMAISRRHLVSPNSIRDASWWTPEWELHGMYLWPSDRVMEPELLHRYGGAAGVRDATGVMCFWMKTSPNGDYNNYSDEDLTMRITFNPGLPYGDVIDESFSQIVAAATFLKLPFVSTEKRQVLNHNERKPFKASATVPAEITTILLRKPETQARHADEDDSEHKSINYKHCWVVGGNHGFWRKAKPNSKTGNPEYVRPYLKGNTAMPFKKPSTTIKVATR